MRPSVVIESIGCAAPRHRISNDFFETIGLPTSSEWIEQRTGIKSRYSVLSPEMIVGLKEGNLTLEQLRASGSFESIGDFSQRAWQNLLADYKRPISSLDLLICGTSVPDYDIPANACVIADRIGVDAGLSFDVNSACSSFVTDVFVARSLMLSGSVKNAAVFNTERYSTRMNYADRSSCILFGDGAACAYLSLKEPASSGLEIIDGICHSDPKGYSQVIIPDGGYFWQNGAAVQKFAITRTCEVSLELLERNHLSTKDVTYFIGHQANLRMLQSCCERLGFSADQHLFNVDERGNQGAAGAPTVLAENFHRFRKGDLVLVSVVGSGLTWGSLLMAFC